MTRLSGEALRRHAAWIIAARRRYTRRMAELIWRRARAGGWAIGDSGVMCPPCRRTDPALAKLATELERSVRR